MSKVANLQMWLGKNCPNIWSLLSQKAHKVLPRGILEYLSPPSLEKLAVDFPRFTPEYLLEIAKDYEKQGKDNLIVAEKEIKKLINVCGSKNVGDAYRRDLSGVGTERRLAELLCEITFCAGICDYAKILCLRPPSGKGTYCDISFQLADYTVYGEVKRYEDIPQFHRPLGKRGRDIASKLLGVPRQFPDGTLNIVFIFHPAIGESIRYLQQALFGESTFFEDPTKVSLKKDGLFAKKEWCPISGCCLIRIHSYTLYCIETWENPRAHVPIPLPVRTALDKLKP